MLQSGEMVSPLSLAFLASDDKQSMLYYLFSNIDLLAFWWVAVIGIGIGSAFKFTNQKGMIIAFSWWGIFVAIGAGFKAMF